MITSQTKKVYEVDGQEFTALQTAQIYALSKLLQQEFRKSPDPSAKGLGLNQDEIDQVARGLIAHADEIVDILTTRPGSLAQARKVNGGKKPRKAKAVQPAHSELPGQEVLKGAQ